jgi:hypothetical protein
MEPHQKVELIPLELHATLFPPSEISIEDLLKFRLLVQQQSTPNLQTSSFLVKKAPLGVTSSHIQLLRTLPIPSEAVVAAFSDSAAISALSESSSVIYAHLPEDSPSRSIHFPTWVIPYWSTLSRLSRHVILPWMRAEQWLAVALLNAGNHNCKGTLRFALHRFRASDIASGRLLTRSPLPWSS